MSVMIEFRGRCNLCLSSFKKFSVSLAEDLFDILDFAP